MALLITCRWYLSVGRVSAHKIITDCVPVLLPQLNAFGVASPCSSPMHFYCKMSLLTCQQLSSQLIWSHSHWISLKYSLCLFQKTQENHTNNTKIFCNSAEFEATINISNKQLTGSTAWRPSKTPPRQHVILKWKGKNSMSLLPNAYANMRSKYWVSNWSFAPKNGAKHCKSVF